MGDWRVFRGLIPPVATPMRPGTIDLAGIASLVEHTVDHLDGMVVCGSVGEGPSLSLEQRREAAEAFAEAVAGRVPLILGCAATATDDLRALLRMGESAGVAGFLVPLPFYFRHDGSSVRRFYREVARATDREVVIYDNPFTTKTSLGVEEIAAIAEESPNINHVKITDPNLAKPAALRAISEVRMLAGSDEVMHHQVARGCVGAMTAIPQIYPRAARAWFDALAAGDLDEARRRYDRMLPLILELTVGADQYPAVVKFALARLGVIADDEVWPPLAALDAIRREEIAQVMDLNTLDEATL